MQTEDNAKQASLFLLLRCRLSYQEIVQTEDNAKQASLFLHILRDEGLPSLVVVEYSYLNDMTLVFVTIFYQLYSLRFAWTFWLYSFRCFSIGCLCCCMAAIVWIDCVVSANVSSGFRCSVKVWRIIGGVGSRGVKFAPGLGSLFFFFNFYFILLFRATLAAYRGS